MMQQASNLKSYFASLYLNPIGSDVTLYVKEAAVDEDESIRNAIHDRDGEWNSKLENGETMAFLDKNNQCIDSTEDIISTEASPGNKATSRLKNALDESENVINDNVLITDPSEILKTQSIAAEGVSDNVSNEMESCEIETAENKELLKNIDKQYEYINSTRFKNCSISECDSPYIYDSETENQEAYLKTLPSFPAHKLILAQSPVFRAMFYTSNLMESQTNIQHVVIPNISEVAFQEFLKFLYTEKIDLNNNNALEILFVASKYQLSYLEHICCKFIVKIIDVSNVLFLHQQGRISVNTILVGQCMNFICKHGEKVLFHESLSKLSREEAKFYLNCDDIAISELKRFQAIYNWARNRCIQKHNDSLSDLSTTSELRTSKYDANSESKSIEEKHSTNILDLMVDEALEETSQYEPTPNDIRQEMGDLLYTIRFARIDPNDFALKVLPLNILSHSEAVNIFSYISTQGITPLNKFIDTPREIKQYNILILGGDQMPHIEDVMQSLLEAHTKDTWFIQGKLNVQYVCVRYHIPTLDRLLNYDSVLVFSNYCLKSPTLLGDLLAEYVDKGGGCVIQAFTCVKKYNIEGRFLLDDYMGITLGENDTNAKFHAYQILDVTHPVLSGVKEFDPGRYRGEIALLPTGREIARYADGIPLIVETTSLRDGRALNGRVITMNFFPVSYKLKDKYWIGDGNTLLLNALIYASQKSTPY